jgi:hypothetical protein
MLPFVVPVKTGTYKLISHEICLSHKCLADRLPHINYGCIACPEYDFGSRDSGH